MGECRAEEDGLIVDVSLSEFVVDLDLVGWELGDLAAN
jgi:hypothetical protein